MFATAQLLRDWCEQRPSNQGDLGSSVTGEGGGVYYTGLDLLLISFLYRNRPTWLLLGSILNGALCMNSFIFVELQHPEIYVGIDYFSCRTSFHECFIHEHLYQCVSHTWTLVPVCVSHVNTCTSVCLTHEHLYQCVSHTWTLVPVCVSHMNTCTSVCLTREHLYQCVSHTWTLVPVCVSHVNTCTSVCLTHEHLYQCVSHTWRFDTTQQNKRLFIRLVKYGSGW
jgi:hypothetical protein